MTGHATLPPVDVEEACPVCKSTRYLNPKMVLLVSPCYHRMCETCINRLFLHGSAPCPLCGTILRKGNFVAPTFEDLRVEKECRIRRAVSKAFYKRAEDFANERAYNDYLEEVEDMVFNLVNDVNVQSTYARLEAFKTENRDLLERNFARQAHEQRQTQLAEETEQQHRDAERKRMTEELEEEQTALLASRKRLINDLATSSAPAAVIVAEAQKQMQMQLRSSTATTASHPRKTRKLPPVELPALPKPSLRPGLRSGQSVDADDARSAFDPMQHVHPLTTQLPLPELSSIPDDFVMELLADCWPLKPSAYAPAEWDVRRQMRAGGFSFDLVKRHCLRAALSWGI